MKILLSIALIKGVSDKITRKGIVTILFNKLLSLKGWNLDQSNIEQFNKVQNIFYWILYYRKHNIRNLTFLVNVHGIPRL